jgi:hypothetical protein
MLMVDRNRALIMTVNHELMSSAGMVHNFNARPSNLSVHPLLSLDR